jgi:hypothetical protein
MARHQAMNSLAHSTLRRQIQGKAAREDTAQRKAARRALLFVGLAPAGAANAPLRPC